MIRVGICAPSRLDFETRLATLVQAGTLPAAALQLDENGVAQMRDQRWNAADGNSWVAYGADFTFIETPAVLDGSGNVITPAVPVAGYCLIIEGDETMLGFTNTGTAEAPVWTNTETVIPAAWEKPELLTQLTKSG